MSGHMLLNHLCQFRTQTAAFLISAAPRRTRLRPLKARTHRPRPKPATPQQGRTLRLPSEYLLENQLVPVDVPADRSYPSNRRSSAKKATPPTAKASAASGGKAAARSGSRINTRQSHEILPPNSKTAPGQNKTPAGSSQSGSSTRLPEAERSAHADPCPLLFTQM